MNGTLRLFSVHFSPLVFSPEATSAEYTMVLLRELLNQAVDSFLAGERDGSV